MRVCVCVCVCVCVYRFVYCLAHAANGGFAFSCVRATDTTMIGATYVCRTVALQDLQDVHIWQRADVAKVLDKSINGDAEAGHVVMTWVDHALAGPIGMILACLGENTDLTGGTMGNPNTVPELAYVLKDVFEDIVIDGCHVHFDGSQPMWSQKEWFKRSFLDFLWTFVDR